jgi:hypothetical protein
MRKNGVFLRIMGTLVRHKPRTLRVLALTDIPRVGGTARKVREVGGGGRSLREISVKSPQVSGDVQQGRHVVVNFESSA